jgi:hypothetical protein
MYVAWVQPELHRMHVQGVQGLIEGEELACVNKVDKLIHGRKIKCFYPNRLFSLVIQEGVPPL